MIFLLSQKKVILGRFLNRKAVRSIGNMNMKETKCPCCGKSNVREYDICNICNWENDPIQKGNPELKGGANEMSLKEAIHAFKNGKEVE